MTFIKPKELGFKKVERVPMYQQASRRCGLRAPTVPLVPHPPPPGRLQMRYKYHVYVDGHCAAMRYASMMPLGAVILKVRCAWGGGRGTGRDTARRHTRV
jgi:hypothetical protein